MSNNSYYNDQWRIINEPNQNKVSNYSMDFDGTNDKIEFGDVNNFERTNSFSGSCWVFYEGVTGASQYIISKHNSSNNKGYQFYLNSVGSLNFIIGPGPGGAVMQVAAGIQQANTWNHFVFTYDGSSLRTGINIYVNGVIQTPFYAGASSITGTIKDASIPFQISGRSGTSANGVNGKIDQVSIFDYELSSSQVSTLYGGGTAVTNPMTLSPKPIAYYQLGDQSVDNGANYLVPNNSLSGSEGFSPYALSLDGVNDYLDANRTVASNLGFSVSAWINPTSYATVMLGTRNLSSASTSNGFTMNINSSGNLFGRIFTETSNIIQVQTGSTISLNNWSHVAMTYDSSTKTLKLYLNGAQAGSIVGTDPSVASIADLDIGRASVGTFYDYFVGKLSNVALWDTDLSSTEVTEIYNQGVPSNLNNFSGTAPVSWWQLGSNSSFNTNWTCLDEIGTNNAVSVNMTNDDIVDGVGYSASGLGTSSIDIKGDAPYSTANGLSKNMDVLDRTTDTPS